MIGLRLLLTPVLITVACTPQTPPAAPAPVTDEVRIEGLFSVVVGDPVAGQSGGGESYWLVDAAGTRTRLLVEPATVRLLGPGARMPGARVRASGTMGGDAGTRAMAVRLLELLEPQR